MRIWKFLSTATALLLAGVANAATFTVTNTSTSGAGSLAQAIASANVVAGPDDIDFLILGLGVFTIPGPFPTIVDAVTIDGYTQPGTFTNKNTEDRDDAVLRIVLDGTDLPAGLPVLQISADDVAIRGLAIRGIPDGGSGVTVDAGRSNAVIDGCFIGTSATGMIAASGGHGIVFKGSGTVGGTSAGARNLISGNDGSGIVIEGGGVFVRNNLIGLNASGQTTLGNMVGIEVASGADDNFIGGVAPGQGNRIAGNEEQGILIDSAAGPSNEIAANDIYGNGKLGIDIDGDGPTPNDENDPDGGANNRQNFPELASARANSEFLRIDGTFNSQPGEYRIDFFLSDGADPGERGQGTHVGSTAIDVINGQSVTRFAATIELDYRPEESVFVSATAENTDLRSSSEFSRTIVAPQGGAELVVTNTNDNGAGSLRAALVTANADAEANTIVFNIPGAPPHLITLASFVSISGGPAFLDGYTQPGSKLNSSLTGTDAVPGVVLDGSAVGATAVLDVFQVSAVVRGISIIHAQKSGVRFFDLDGARIDGSFIGVDGDGTTAAGNVEDGIRVLLSNDVSIGGPARGQRMLIASNGLRGIGDTSTGTRIVNSLIGATPGDASEGNLTDGIFASGTGTIVGGDEPDLWNTIRSNGGTGIRLDGDARVDIRGNRIELNDELGIDIDGGGVTLNDPDDSDEGPNLGQNFPVISDAATFAGEVSIKASLDVPDDQIGKPYDLRAFVSTACDPSGSGEGAVPLGVFRQEIPADELFELAFPADVEVGQFVTMTATDPGSGSTSEFSGCFAVRDGTPVCGDFSGDGAITAFDALAVLQTSVGARDCELCVCDVNGSATITAPDALLVLRFAVGHSVTLDCPSCG